MNKIVIEAKRILWFYAKGFFFMCALLGILIVTDRLIQQAISQILSKEYDKAL